MVRIDNRPLGMELYERRADHPSARLSDGRHLWQFVEDWIESENPLESQILRTLTESGHAQLRQVRIAISGTEVALLGRVPTYYLKQLAQSLVLAVEGVESLRNELEVS
jgi:hypothetical protein